MAKYVERPRIGERTTYYRLFIRRKTPEEILGGGIDRENIEQKIKALVAWFNDMEPDKNFMIEIKEIGDTKEQIEESTKIEQ